MTDFGRKILHPTFAALIFFVIATATLTSFSKNSYALSDEGPGRNRSCDIVGNPESMTRFVPFVQSSKDLLFDMSNPICFTIATTAYLDVKLSIAAMNGICGSGSAVPRASPTPILDVIDIAKGTQAAYKQGVPKGEACGIAVGKAATSIADFMISLEVVYQTAKAVSSNSMICGANWMKANPNDFTFSAQNRKQIVNDTINRWAREDPSKLNLATGPKEYREWYFNGVEVEDNPEDGSDVCLDPTVQTENYPRQKYYLRGTERGNFNCDKYKVYSGQNDPLNGLPYTAKRQSDMITAYKCCTKRSQEYVCVEYNPLSGGLASVANTFGSVSVTERKFCRGGSKCSIAGIVFTSKFRDNNRLICAESYSLCPYNFTIGFGSEDCDYYQDGIWDGNSWRRITQEQIAATPPQCSENSEIRNPDCTFNDKAGKCRNYCQYMTHCTRTGTAAADYRSGLGSPYFSAACLDFAGDSQNKVSYGGAAFGGSQKHFSAPIAQCLKETLENVFYNRAGHSECAGLDEQASADGTCPSGNYHIDLSGFTYRAGNLVNSESFFSGLQRKMRTVVKFVLTLSIMFYGMNILMGKSDIRNKKDILTYIIKIAVVMYFTMGDAWQTQFFNGVYNASSEFSRLVFKVTSDADPLKRDGCQFLDYETTDGGQTTTSGDIIRAGMYYPEGKNYLALWDTLDCKIMLYLGFGPEASVANITLLIVAAFFTGAVGMYVALSVMCFGFFFIAATVRALHIFLSSGLAIIIFVFLTPIIFPLMLFERTKGIFDGWVKNLISFTLQPMLLFAYIAVFVMVMDRALIGSATFRGASPAKALSCSKYCEDALGTKIANNPDGTPYACDQKGEVIIDPMSDSMACLIGFNQFGKFPGFEMFGIGIPFLFNLLTDNPQQKILTFMRGALVMYLLYKFMDEIPSIVTDLLGGASLPGNKSNPLAMFQKVAGIAAAIQQRAAGGAKRLKEGVESGAERASNYADSGKDKTNKEIADSKRSSGGDHSSGSDGGDKGE